MEYRVQQNRSLQLIQAIDRQGDRNLRVFPKAKVIQAFSQLNPDRDNFLVFWKISFWTRISAKTIFRKNLGLENMRNRLQTLIFSKLRRRKTYNSCFANFHLFTLPTWQSPSGAQLFPVFPDFT